MEQETAEQRSPAVHQLINALRLYMDHDACVCDPCSDPDCQGCMYCIGHSALIVVGYIEREQTE